MYNWRITKYNPIYRTSSGAYNIDDWTSFSDIGRIYGGKEINFSDYIAIESAYIKAITSFMEELEIDSLEVKNLEKNSDRLELPDINTMYSKEMIEMFLNVHNNLVADKSSINILCRLVLREYLWCKLEIASTMFVHFGHDYYMYIGSIKECKDAIGKIIKSGLFVEAFKSPYCKNTL